MSNTIYWTMRNGTQISVDDMDINHLRNTLKMIIRNIEKLDKPCKDKAKKRFRLNGEVAQDMVDTGYLEDELDQYDLDWGL